MTSPQIIHQGINQKIVSAFVNNLRNITKYGDAFQDTILHELAKAVQDTQFEWLPNGNLMIKRDIQTDTRHCGASAGILAADLKTMTLPQFFARVMTIAYAHQLFV